MSLHRQINSQSFTLALKADRAAPQIHLTRAERVALYRESVCIGRERQMAAEAKAREIAAQEREGRRGYRLVADRLRPYAFDVTLDGVVVGEAGRDGTTGEWYLVADDRLNNLPPRFQYWHDYFDSAAALAVFLGAPVSMEAA